MPTYVYRCKCGWEGTILREYETRNEPEPCQKCEGIAPRAFSGYTINVSTRNSASMPAEVSKGRFDHLREAQTLNKEIAHARAHQDWGTEKKARAEKKKVKGKSDSVKE